MQPARKLYNYVYQVSKIEFFLHDSVCNRVASNNFPHLHQSFKFNHHSSRFCISFYTKWRILRINIYVRTHDTMQMPVYVYTECPAFFHCVLYTTKMSIDNVVKSLWRKFEMWFNRDTLGLCLTQISHGRVYWIYLSSISVGCDFCLILIL